jgi:hypothetical protein
MATPPALQVDTVGGGPDGAAALGDRLPLPGAALVLVASGVHVLCNLLQALSRLWEAARIALLRLVVPCVEGLVHPVERLFYLGQGLGGSPLCGGHRGRDGLA